jgi:hypothetical protein
MKALALRPSRQPLRPKDTGTPVLAQRRSTFGPLGSVPAPAIPDAGRPLDPGVRGQMEAGFGRDFSNVRVHDDARAHDSARALSARAYAAGDHLVFGEGAYRPGLAAGQALIAHELAHSVQQAGVQMKREGALPAEVDAELEAQADRAATAVLAGRPVPALSRIGAPAVFRAQDDPPAGGSAEPLAAGPPQKLPPGMIPIRDEPKGIGTTELVVAVSDFVLPAPKGAGAWVQKAYTESATGGRLVFTPLIEGGRVAAYKEGAEDYKAVWLKSYGFTSTSEVASAFKAAAASSPEVKTALADKAVAKLVNGLGKDLKKAECDIDHIVEKQVGGVSIPSNLQILTSTVNQKSGRDTYAALVKLVNDIRDPSMRGPGVRKLQLHIKQATVTPGPSDASYVVEDLLRRGVVKGSDAVKAKAEGTAVSLTAGGVGETVRIQEKGKTPIDSMARRIVPGIRLTVYERGPGGPNSKVDRVQGELDSRAISKTGSSKSEVKFTAKPGTAGPGTGAGTDPDGEPALEGRVLELAKPGNERIEFYYPYLSPGRLTSVSLDEKGALTGTGVIKPSIAFLPELKIRYGEDLLEVIAPLSHDKLSPPIPHFRFTDGQLSLALFPTFVPSGSLKFEVGPKGRPVMLGDIVAKYEGGAFVATGALTPGGKIPGIKDAAGKVEYHSEQGWSGKLTATSSTMPLATSVSAELGFTSGKGGVRAYGAGGITTKIKDSDLVLKASWHGAGVHYEGAVTVPKPLPLVEKVRLEGSYAEDTLRLKGDAAITWKSFSSTMTVNYVRKDGEDDRFFGKAAINVKTDKASGHLDLAFSESGRFTGKGSVAYQVTKNVRPELGVEIGEDRRVKVLGEVKLPDIMLTKEWPKPGGGEISIFKAGAKFNVPTPVPGVTAYGEIRGGLSVGYGIGPAMLKNVKFSGELYPFEEDPKIKASLVGRFSVPAYGELRGLFGAYIGAEVLLGAVGAKGGIDLKPTLTVRGEGAIDFNAAYESEGFSFAAEAYARGQMFAALKVDLSATVYAAWGLFSHTWEYPLKNVSKPLGPELKITLGKIAYARTGEITWPDISQIEVTPKEIDPLAIVKELLSESKTPEREEAKAKLREMGWDV